MTAPAFTGATPSARFVRSVYRRIAPYYRNGLYFLESAPDWKVLLYAQRLLVARLIATVRGVLMPRPCDSGDLVVMETANQTRVLTLALEEGLIAGDVCWSTGFDRRLSAMLALQNAAALILVPLVYLLRRRRGVAFRYIHERLFLKASIRAMAGALQRQDIRMLTISNDHLGLAMRLGIVARGLGLPVTYVQHGGVHERFPKNDFSRLLLWDAHSAAIYRTRSPAEIEIHPVLKGNDRVLVDHTGAILLALSSINAAGDVVRTARVLRRTGRPVVIRFHPADRRARLTLLAARLFADRQVTRDHRDQVFAVSYRSCAWCASPMSSVMLDALDIAPEKLVWLQYLGDSNNDYYGIADRIPRICETLATLKDLVPILSEG